MEIPTNLSSWLSQKQKINFVPANFHCYFMASWGQLATSNHWRISHKSQSDVTKPLVVFKTSKFSIRKFGDVLLINYCQSLLKIFTTVFTKVFWFKRKNHPGLSVFVWAFFDRDFRCSWFTTYLAPEAQASQKSHDLAETRVLFEVTETIKDAWSGKKREQTQESVIDRSQLTLNLRWAANQSRGKFNINLHLTNILRFTFYFKRLSLLDLTPKCIRTQEGAIWVGSRFQVCWHICFVLSKFFLFAASQSTVRLC